MFSRMNQVKYTILPLIKDRGMELLYPKFHVETSTLSQQGSGKMIWYFTWCIFERTIRWISGPSHSELIGQIKLIGWLPYNHVYFCTYRMISPMTNVWTWLMSLNQMLKTVIKSNSELKVTYLIYSTSKRLWVLMF